MEGKEPALLAMDKSDIKWVGRDNEPSFGFLTGLFCNGQLETHEQSNNLCRRSPGPKAPDAKQGTKLGH